MRKEAQACVAQMMRSHRDLLLPSASFRSIPRDSERFRTDLLSECYAESLSSSRMEPDLPLIHKNIAQIRSLTPDRVAYQRKQRAVLGSVRAQAAIAASLNIRDSLRALRVQHQTDKARRLDIRQHVSSWSRLVQEWTVCSVGLQQLGTLQALVTRKKQRQSKTMQNLALWTRVTRVIGRLCRRLWQRRERKALLSLMVLRPHIRRWRNEHRRVCGQIIAYSLTSCTYRLQVRRVMTGCKEKARKIQWFLGQMVLRKEAQAQLMVLQWERYEAEQIAELRKRVGRRLTLAQRVALTEVPLYMKTANCVRLRRNLMLRSLKCLRLSSTIPRFSAILDYDLVIKLHQTANKSRHMWDPSLYFPRLVVR